MMMKIKTTKMNANKLVDVGRFYTKMMANNTAAMSQTERELFRILKTNMCDLSDSEKYISVAFMTVLGSCVGFTVKVVNKPEQR